ncbi:MAG TPA: GGDEF domain-containing protein [Planctomycetaceae bacterium]|nr:GGDEF domain-containing protein [Planctomycetaceae bacterium]
MDSSLLICLLGSYLVIGFGLGWLWARGRRPVVADASALEDLRLNVAQQAIRLNGFRRELETSCDRGTGLDREHVEQTYESTRLFEEQLDKGRERISQLAGDGSDWKRLMEDVCSHRDRVHQFSALLARSLEEDRPEQFAGALIMAVSELCQSNRGLDAELQEARRTIAVQQSRLEEAERDARIDPLTKLANRRAFDEQLDACQSRFDRGQEEFAVVLFDLDRFKSLNDQYGHRTGDAVLAVFGRILAESVRGYDHAARLGGEEFAALLPAAGERAARLVAERCRRRVEQAVVHQNGKEVRFTASAGVAAVREGETSLDLLERADAALYEAKVAGRNCVCVSKAASAGLSETAPREARLAAV